jgi:hypothetical protein
MNIQTMLAISGFITAMLSAGSWFWASILKPVYPMGYISGPPKEIVDRLNFQSKLNAAGAFLAGISVICQGVGQILPVLFGS